MTRTSRRDPCWEFDIDNFRATGDLLLDAAREWRTVPDRFAVDKAMRATPPGSHGRFWGFRKADGGHVLNVWNDGNRVWFIDGQTSRIQWIEGGRILEFDIRTGQVRPRVDTGYDEIRLLLTDF